MSGWTDRIMTTDVLRASFAEPSRLRQLFEWLRHMKVALNLPSEQFGGLSEHYRRDTGIPQKDIKRAVDTELGRFGLLDIGWQPSRRPVRR